MSFSEEKTDAEKLEEFRDYWWLDDLVDNPSKLEQILRTLISVVVSQQEYIEETKRLAADRRKRD